MPATILAQSESIEWLMPSPQLHQHTRQGLHAGMKKWQTHSCRGVGAQLDLGSDSNNSCRSNLCRRAVSRLHACRVSRRKAQEDETTVESFLHKIQGHMNQRKAFPSLWASQGLWLGNGFAIYFPVHRGPWPSLAHVSDTHSLRHLPLPTAPTVKLR